MLLIEILLTVFVWRKGWNWFSLIPVGAAFLIGAIVGLTGGVQAASNPGIILIDVMAVIALIIMLVYPPKKTPTPPTPEQ